MDKAIVYLMENGSPAIRWRTAVEILGENSQLVFQRAQNDYLEYAMLQRWLSRLGPITSFNSLHGAEPEAFENVVGKLHDLGFRSWMLPEFNSRIQTHLQALNPAHTDHGLGEFARLGLLNTLLVSGCENEFIQAGILQRIQELADFVSLDIYDLYIDQQTYGAFPKGFKERPLINPIYNNRLPLIWDIVAIAHLPTGWRSKKVAQQINTIISYILDPHYQALPVGYGVMYHPPTRRYYAMGWSIHLPDSNKLAQQPGYFTSMLIQRLELMSHFKTARESVWFQHTLTHLQNYETNTGTYLFPKEYLREQASGYWVTGAYMRLEEDRRRKAALELDSTFRMLLIKNMMENPD